MRRRTFLLVSAAGALLGQLLRPLIGKAALRRAADPAPDQDPEGDLDGASDLATAGDQDTASAAGSGRAVEVASVAELNRTGQLLVRSRAMGPLLLIRHPGTKQLQAVNPTCPHRGCTVAWSTPADSFICPCHQARFNATGRWIGGKAVNRPLQSYKVTVSNGRILVSRA